MVKSYIGFFLLGMFTTLWLLVVCQQTPKDYNEKWEDEIVKRNYGEWVIVDKTIKFKWKD